MPCTPCESPPGAVARRKAQKPEKPRLRLTAHSCEIVGLDQLRVTVVIDNPNHMPIDIALPAPCGLEPGARVVRSAVTGPHAMLSWSWEQSWERFTSKEKACLRLRVAVWRCSVSTEPASVCGPGTVDIDTRNSEVWALSEP